MIDDLLAACRLNLIDVEDRRMSTRAFALVSLAHPTLSARYWSVLGRYYAQRPPNRAGLMLIVDRRGYAHAVFRYAVDRAPPLRARIQPGSMNGCVLRVQDLVLAQVCGYDAEAALCRCTERLAVSLSCREIRLELPAGAMRGDSPARWPSLGFHPVGMTTLMRSLDPSGGR